jgi:phosphate transport system protein
MPKKFNQDLAELRKNVLLMGETAEAMIHDSMRALVDRQEELIQGVEQKEDVLDRMQVAIDDHVVRLIVTYAPVAQDLRFLLMVARINTELERVGDQAIEICQNVRLLLGVPPLKPLVDLPKMATIAEHMLHGGLKAFSESAPEQALEIMREDDQVDALNDQLFRELLTYMMSDARNIPRALALLLTARSVERIADHAVNICEEVVYLVRGQDIRHQPRAGLK